MYFGRHPTPDFFLYLFSLYHLHFATAIIYAPPSLCLQQRLLGSRSKSVVLFLFVIKFRFPLGWQYTWTKNPISHFSLQWSVTIRVSSGQWDKDQNCLRPAGKAEESADSAERGPFYHFPSFFIEGALQPLCIMRWHRAWKLGLPWDLWNHIRWFTSGPGLHERWNLMG